MDPSQVNKQTCMCVDLDPDFYYLIQSYAERSGLCALHVGQASETLHLARQIHPAVICLERGQHSNQPVRDVLNALKTDQETAPIPIILFSWLDEEDKSSKSGADVYVKKPLMYVDFLDALAAVGISHQSP